MKYRNELPKGTDLTECPGWLESNIVRIKDPAHYWYDDVPNGEKIKFDCEIVSVREKYDRNGNLMAFVSVVSVEENIPIEVIVFASTYARKSNLLDKVDHKYITVTGEKDNKKIKATNIQEARLVK
jgi:DNA polymerase III alpha subunit